MKEAWLSLKSCREAGQLISVCALEIRRIVFLSVIKGVSCEESKEVQLKGLK